MNGPAPREERLSPRELERQKRYRELMGDEAAERQRALARRSRLCRCGAGAAPPADHSHGCKVHNDAGCIVAPAKPTPAELNHSRPTHLRLVDEGSS